MSSSSSISSSFRLFTTRIPTSLFTNKTLLLSSTKPKTRSFFRPISFQPIATNNSSTAASASASSSASLQSIEELPPKLQELVKLFQSVPLPKPKYEQLLSYGKNLKPLDSQFKTKHNKVQGCVSQVWVRAYLDSDRNVVFEADSDSLLTKGMAALLVNGLSGQPAEEVLRVSPDFVVLFGLQLTLTPSRNNGFLNMFKLMQKKALELLLEAETGSEGVESSNLGSNSGSESDNNMESSNFGSNSGFESANNVESSNLGSNSGFESENNVESSNFGSNSESGFEDELNTETKNQGGSNLGDLGSRGKRIKDVLKRELRPIELQVEDISYQHAGHAGARGSDGETHFNLKVVSSEFEGKSLVKRHRLIYGLLQEELQSGLHALSIVAKTPSEV